MAVVAAASAAAAAVGGDVAGQQVAVHWDTSADGCHT